MLRLHRVAPFLFLAASLAAVALLPGTGKSVPLYAARTGLMCGSCHFDPNGGGPRNDFGFAYARNRHAIEADTSGEWKDLNLRNRVSDDFPLYVGLNQRFMLLGDRQPAGPDNIDRVGFWNMENAIYATFQPHPRLTLVYDLEATIGSNYQSRDAFAMIGLGADHYLKAGQFRVPFGLRTDDHTVATRNSFLDYNQNGGRFLPYDPRLVDRGVELGGSHGNMFGRVSYTNGSSATVNFPPLDNQHPQAVAAKFGYNMPWYQGAVSLYDDWSTSGGGDSQRATRWGYYALAHRGPVAVVGEIAAGTDQRWDSFGRTRTNLMAGFVEADWAPHKAYNLRFRYDRLELNRAFDDPARALNNFNRFALEGEWVPVPFAELRWTLRLIDPVAEDDGFGTAIEDEKQAYLQLHVSY